MTKPWLKHLGSTVALVVGVLLFLVGVSQIGQGVPDGGETALNGEVMVLGAAAYRSAKKRKLGQVEGSKLRIGLELLGLILLVLLVVLRDDLKTEIVAHPVGNLLAPLWALIAYAVVVMFGKKAADA